MWYELCVGDHLYMNKYTQKGQWGGQKRIRVHKFQVYVYEENSEVSL